MTNRQKKGVGFIVSGAVFIGVGGILIGLPATPAWVDTAVMIVGLIAQGVGLAVTLPEGN